MNQENHEPVTLDDETLGDNMLYLPPNPVISIDFYDEKAVGIELPNTVTLEVIETEPSLKGPPPAPPTSRPRWRPAWSSRCRPSSRCAPRS